MERVSGDTRKVCDKGDSVYCDVLANQLRDLYEEVKQITNKERSNLHPDDYKMIVIRLLAIKSQFAMLNLKKVILEAESPKK